MPVPVVEVDSTSPSPEKVPPAIFTVAPASLRLSGSDTVTALDSVTALPSVKLTLLATLASVGASLTLVTVSVVVASALVATPPLAVPLGSPICQVRMRVWLEK